MLKNTSNKFIDIPNINEIINDFYTSVYLIKTKKILQRTNNQHTTILRFTHFSKKPLFVSGIAFCIEIIKQVMQKQKVKLDVWAVKDGGCVTFAKPILVIKGNYSVVATLENVLDGILARCSSITSNCKEILKVIDSKKIINMADRADLYINHPFDGYSAYIAGIRNFTTNSQVLFLKNKKDVNVVGTVPHSLIQQFNGDLLKALKAYSKVYPNDNLTALVDYHNNIVAEINKIKTLGKRIKFIRIDTSNNLIDKSLPKVKNNYGINANLVKLARKTLNKCGLKHTKIIVSSSLDINKIKQLIKQEAPIDIFGIGKALLNINCNITCDLVQLDNKKQAKFNRQLGIDFKKINQYLIKYI